MITVRELLSGFESLPIKGQAVIAHGSFKALGRVQGGPRVVVDALVRTCGSVIMPTFTYQTMVTPLTGPPNNAIDYAAEEENRKWKNDGNGTYDAVSFRRSLPADKEMGILPEFLRRHHAARRSIHPILSFTGVNADFALAQQTIDDPLAPIGALGKKNGWVVLIGVNNTVNTSIHYAEKLAGRRQFVRWAWTRKRIVECPNFPGDSAGFEAISPFFQKDMKAVTIGDARVTAIPLHQLFKVVKMLIEQDPLALLCQRMDCKRCNALRELAD
jgi:aminoglycoside 3-N-acetyltransferase